MRATRHGLTLLELLAVVVLLGMVATAVSVVPLIARNTAARAEAFAAQLQRQEQRARTTAIGSGGSFRLATDEVRFEPAALPLAAPAWATPVAGLDAARLLVAGRPSDRLSYDPNGRSDDAVLILRSGTDERRFAIQGLTGVWSAEVGMAPALGP